MDKVIKHTDVLDGQGFVELTDMMGDELKIVETARSCFGKHTYELSDNDKAILKGLVRDEHWSPFESVVLTFRVKAPIFVVRQWFRHRTWSYAELSRRYTKEEPEYYTPSAMRLALAYEDAEEDMLKLIKRFHVACTDMWKLLLHGGVSKEVARIILPVSLMTEFYGTVDLRNLLAFIKLRTDPHAQYEIREYANAIKNMVKELFPTVAEAQWPGEVKYDSN